MRESHLKAEKNLKTEKLTDIAIDGGNWDGTVAGGGAGGL